MELRAQVKRFVELTGHLPDHMDGHQHVHVLPGEHIVTANYRDLVTVFLTLAHGSQIETR